MGVELIIERRLWYGEWWEIFKEHVIAAVVRDRYSIIVRQLISKGKVYRLKERKKQGIKTGNTCQWFWVNSWKIEKILC